ncbi:TPA: phage protein NinX family protein [Morganella morganii]
MNKYRDKSDFEINCQVLATFVPDIEHMCLSNDERSFYHCGFDGNGFYETTIPDYCNNPADAMPIVIENEISMVRVNNEWSARQFNNHCIEVNNSNYYRAAMICFLMMKNG